MLFNRDYELTIQYDDTTVTIKPPMRITFDAFKSHDGGLNKCTLNIYNLREDTRIKLVKNPEDNDNRVIYFILKVGYDGQMKDAFKGQVLRGEYSKDDIDFISKLESLDGGFDIMNKVISKTVSGKQNAIKQALEGTETEMGVITQQSELTRPKVIVGNVIKKLDDLLEADQTWFIDNGKLNILKANEVIEGFTPLVNSDTGLITTPRKEQNIIEFETLMNPSIRLGGLVQLQSVVYPGFNGRHKVFEINYKGDYDGDDWSMTVRCIVGTYETIN